MSRPLVQVDPLNLKGKTNEERIQLAIAAINQNGFKANGNPVLSFCEAARLFEVPSTTLTERFKGRETCKDAHQKQRKLDAAAEQALVEWIQECGYRNIPLHESAIAAHAKAISGVEVGECWVKRFRARHPELKARWAKGQEKCRAECLNPTTVADFFEKLAALKREYNIKDECVYNADEKGCQAGIGDRVKVLVDRTQKDVNIVEDGNRELITIIECICADGTAIQPSIIMKGVRRNLEWSRDNPCNASILHSPNGWTDQELGSKWLERDFDPATKEKASDGYRLLILDGHNSHTTYRFCQYAKKHKIIILCLPPHTTHRLQPCDVGFFGPLGKSWKAMVSEASAEYIPIRKTNFVKYYAKAREKVLKPETILGAFRKTGISPLDPSVIEPKAFAPSLNTTTKSALPIAPQTPQIVQLATGRTPRTQQLCQRHVRWAKTTSPPILQTPIRHPRLRWQDMNAAGVGTLAQHASPRPPAIVPPSPCIPFNPNLLEASTPQLGRLLSSRESPIAQTASEARLAAASPPNIPFVAQATAETGPVQEDGLAVTDDVVAKVLKVLPCFRITGLPPQIPVKHATLDRLKIENQLLRDLLKKASYQMSRDYALQKLMEQENERLRKRLFEKKNKPRKRLTAGLARHMTSEECLEALARDVWESSMKDVFRSPEWKAYKQKCAAQEKRLVEEEKEAEREIERERKRIEREEKAREKAMEQEIKRREREQKKANRDAKKTAKAAAAKVLREEAQKRAKAAINNKAAKAKATREKRALSAKTRRASLVAKDVAEESDAMPPLDAAQPMQEPTAAPMPARPRPRPIQKKLVCFVKDNIPLPMPGPPTSTIQLSDLDNACSLETQLEMQGHTSDEAVYEVRRSSRLRSKL